jgi:hypothetical protein
MLGAVQDLLELPEKPGPHLVSVVADVFECGVDLAEHSCRFPV